MQLIVGRVAEILRRRVRGLSASASRVTFAPCFTTWGGDPGPAVDEAQSPEDAAIAAAVLGDPAATPSERPASRADAAAGAPPEVPATPTERDDTGAAEGILMAVIQDISNTLLEDFKLNDVLRIILETMYRAKGFKRVILCVRDSRSQTMAGRFGFGTDAAAHPAQSGGAGSQAKDVAVAVSMRHVGYAERAA